MNEANVSSNGSLSYGPTPDHEIIPTQEPVVRACSEFNGRRITIQPLHHGYHVEVGCQSFAIEDARRLTYLIGEYLKDPNGLEKIWFEHKVLPS